MVFKIFCIPMLWTKVASALQGLNICLFQLKLNPTLNSIILDPMCTKATLFIPTVRHSQDSLKYIHKQIRCLLQIRKIHNC